MTVTVVRESWRGRTACALFVVTAAGDSLPARRPAAPDHHAPGASRSRLAGRIGRRRALGLNSETLAVCCASQAATSTSPLCDAVPEACGLGPERWNSNSTPEQRLRHSCPATISPSWRCPCTTAGTSPATATPLIPPSRRRLRRCPAPLALRPPRSPRAPMDAGSSASPCGLQPSPPCTRGCRTCCRASARPCACTRA
jgi:hypothetical protein